MTQSLYILNKVSDNFFLSIAFTDGNQTLIAHLLRFAQN